MKEEKPVLYMLMCISHWNMIRFSNASTNTGECFTPSFIEAMNFSICLSLTCLLSPKHLTFFHMAELIFFLK